MPEQLIRKRNDTTAWPLTCKDKDGGVSLTGATLKVFGRLFSAADGSVAKINDAGTATADADQVTNPGLLSYAPGSGETDTAGIYYVEVEVTFSGPVITTFPEQGYFRLEIVEDLG